MSTTDNTTIVFLHIPKTAGQTIHAELSRVYGPKAISPVRVHTEADPGAGQFPPGYKLYSGHIDWEALETLPEPRFVFTVLRDPLERIASFYFYLRRKAEELTPAELNSPSRVGMRMALDHGPDDYFFGGTPDWQRFIRDHYHSPYCAYLTTRRIRGYSQVARMPQEELIQRSLEAARRLDGIYAVDGLDLLEAEFKSRLNINVDLTGRFVNSAPDSREALRWPRLADMIEREETLERLHQFALADQVLMSELGLR